MATIALVDDDKNILTSVSMLLEQEGYHVRTYLRWRVGPDRAFPPRRPTSPSSTSRCRAWTGWNSCAACARAATCR